MRSRLAAWMTTGCLLGLLAAAGATPAAGTQHPRDLDFPELRQIQVPEPDRHELENGLVIYLLEDHEFPMVEVRTLTRGGTAFDPQDRIGLASMTAQVMRTGGTETQPGDALDELVERIGTVLRVSAGEAAFVSRLSTLPENLDVSLSLFADVLRNPTFPEDKIGEARSQERTTIASRNDESLTIAFRELSKLVFGPDSPYGWHTEYATVDAVTGDDMRAMHGQFFHPDLTVLVAWGDFDTDDMKSRLAAALGDWPPSGVQIEPPPGVPDPTPAGLYYAEKLDVTQSTVVIGNVSIQRNDPMYAAAMVMNNALGAGFGSRIFDEIRTRRGLAYAAGANFTAPYQRKGTTAAYVLTQADSTVASLGYLIREIEKVQESGITDDELDRAKDALLNEFVFEFDSVGEVVVRQAWYEFYGYPPDFLSTFQAEVRAVTPEDVQTAAVAIFRPAEWKILVVGNQEQFSRPLDTVMPVQTLDIGIPAPVVTFIAPTPTPESLAAGGAIMAGALDSYGGPSTLGEVSSVEMVGAATATVQGMALQINYRSAFQAPQSFYSEQQVMGQTVKEVVVGDSGWRSTPMGTQPMTEKDLLDHRSGVMGSVDLPFLAGATEMEFVALGPEMVDGVTYDVLYVPDAGEDLLRLYVDPESGLVLRTQSRGEHPMSGAPVNQTLVFADFREVGGVQFPFASEVFFDGELFLSNKVTEIKVNEAIDPALFAEP